MIYQQVFVEREHHDGNGEGGTLYIGDNAAVLEKLQDSLKGSVRAIYIDPPFLTGKVFSLRMRIGDEGWEKSNGRTILLDGYDDKLDRASLLALLERVIRASRELLTDDGLMFVHIDTRLHPHVRLMMDGIFGEKNFRNDIIWAYNSGGRAYKGFSKKHDNILMYSKSDGFCFFADSIRIKPDTPRKNHMKRDIDQDGRTFRSIVSAGKVYRYYDDEPVVPTDVWTDIAHLQQKDPERTGLETQKPMLLLDRIWKCSSEKGNTVCDFFSGSGTSLESAARLGRRFIGTDINPLAANMLRRRLSGFQYDIVHPMNATGREARVSLMQGIGNYHITLEDFSVQEKTKDDVRGLDAVDSWSVGYFSNGVYHVLAESIRTRKQPQLSSELLLPMYTGKIAMAVYDVWGGMCCYTFDSI